jgi:cytochrome b561
VDFVLHQAGLSWIGGYLGPAGTLLIVLSFMYSLRKRKRITFGAPKRLLELHETLSWVGALLILVHAGIHVNAILPWLAVVAMLVVVASGFTGSVLLKRSTAAVKAQAQAGPLAEDNATLDGMTLDLMKRWRQVHMPINAVFAALFGIHLATILLLRHW